jgi:hypothetical protein
VHCAEPADVIAAEFLCTALERFADAKVDELLKWRIEIGFTPDQKVESLHEERSEFELKLPRAGLDTKTYIGSPGGDCHGKIRLRPLDRFDAVEIAFPQTLSFEQLRKYQFAAGFWLA